MTQTFVNFAINDSSQRAQALSALDAAGFVASTETRETTGYVVHVRARKDTDDEREIRRIVAAAAPGASDMPPSSPVKVIRGYRE